MFRNSRASWLLCVVAAAAFAAACATLLQPSIVRDSPFQQATGGIGLAPAVSPAWSFFLLDPRLESFCENELWPVPGITCYSPYHGALVADPPPLERARFEP